MLSKMPKSPLISLEWLPHSSLPSTLHTNLPFCEHSKKNSRKKGKRKGGFVGITHIPGAGGKANHTFSCWRMKYHKILWFLWDGLTCPLGRKETPLWLPPRVLWGLYVLLALLFLSGGASGLWQKALQCLLSLYKKASSVWVAASYCSPWVFELGFPIFT